MRALFAPRFFEIDMLYIITFTAIRKCHSNGMYVHSFALWFKNIKKKWKNTIRIRYCCFNLRLLSILAHFAQTLYSILFLSYGILRAFVCVCFVHVETDAHTHKRSKRDVKKEPKSFIHSIQVKNRCNSLKPFVRSTYIECIYPLYHL